LTILLCWWKGQALDCQTSYCHHEYGFRVEKKVITQAFLDLQLTL